MGTNNLEEYFTLWLSGNVNPFEEWEEKRKQDPRYLKYKEHKAIPFSFQLGFLTLSVEVEVLENISKHWFQDSSKDNVSLRVAGICFGVKSDTHIEIKQCFEFGYTEDNIITGGAFYKSSLEFLGIYSNGSIPDDSDVDILQKLSRTLKRPVFLIKFDRSETLNKLSTAVFETVFDICERDWMERLLCMQVFSHPPHKGLLNKECCDMENSNKIFYLTFFYPSRTMDYRYDVDITEVQRSKMNERRDIYKIRPTFDDHRHTFFKLAKDEGWTPTDFFKFDDQKDYVKMAENLCSKAKVELRFTFCIPLDGKNRIECLAEILTCRPSNSGSSIKESQCLAAMKFLRCMSSGESLNKTILKLEAKKRKIAEENASRSQALRAKI